MSSGDIVSGACEIKSRKKQNHANDFVESFHILLLFGPHVTILAYAAEQEKCCHMLFV